MPRQTNESRINWLHASLYLTALAVMFGAIYSFTVLDRDMARMLLGGSVAFTLFIVIVTTNWAEELEIIRQCGPTLAALGWLFAIGWSVKEFGLVGPGYVFLVWCYWWAFRSSSRASESRANASHRGPFRDSGVDNPLDDLDGGDE